MAKKITFLVGPLREICSREDGFILWTWVANQNPGFTSSYMLVDSGYFEFLFCCPQQEWAEWGVTQLQLSTVDFNNAPSQEMIQRGVAFIEEMNQNEKTVYVHCKAGRGRSTTLVACYLMKVCSFTANCIAGF